MRGKLKDLTLNRDGGQTLTVTVSGDYREEFDRLFGQDVDITIKKASGKRSQDANSFCWALCTDIAERMGITKEEVYRRAIRDVGKYEPLPIKTDAVERFVEIWTSRGIGWVVDIVDGCKIPGYTKVFAYFGTSTYNQQEMSRLLDYLVQDAESIGIPIPLGKKDMERLLENWR